jgi:hypothetical protein
MSKLKYVIVGILLYSCNRKEQYEYVCYEGIGTNSVTYERYIVKNDKPSAIKYCDLVSTTSKPR